MCGIAGFLDNSRGEISYNLSQVATKMAETMYFRGPDHGEVWVDQQNGFAMSHRRLAVIDLSPTGHQPMVSANKRFVLTYNGEIYNFLDLRKTLQAQGQAFKGHSDTEVLLEACANWGVKHTLSKCIGMFAFGLWDRKTQTLTLGRDRLGIKPLYWGVFGETFIFGSELKALRTHPQFQLSLDSGSLATYLRFGYIPPPYCIYKNVHKLMPGCLLTLKAGLPPKIESYWNLREFVRQSAQYPWELDERETLNYFEEILSDAVKRRLIADVPLGAFLSGGIDSSTIVALMQKLSDRPVQTFTIGFKETNTDESIHAKKVAHHLGTNHHEYIVEPKHIFNVLPKLTDWYDEPFSDISQIPTFLVAEMTRQNVTVALSGDGGDELFAGYSRYEKLSHRLTKQGKIPQILQPLASTLASIPFVLFSPFLSHIPSKLTKMTKKFRTLSEVLACNGTEEHYRKIISRWENPLGILSHSKEESVDIYADKTLEEDFPDPVTRMQYCDMMTHLPEDILAKVDRASMAVSLEVRVPLLDHRVVEFAWRIPNHMKVRDKQSKWLLRQLLNKYVPTDLYERPKMGFGLPLDQWLRGPLREWGEDLISESALKKSGILNPVPIRKRWQEHLAGTHNRARSLWTIITLQSWLNRWM